MTFSKRLEFKVRSLGFITLAYIVKVISPAVKVISRFNPAIGFSYFLWLEKKKEDVDKLIKEIKEYE